MEASALQAPVGISRPPAARLLRFRSDDQLVALFRLGNDEAFRVIHDRYRQRLFAYTRQMLAGSRSDAEDALQDVFLRAYGALRADNRPITLRAWLYRVAHNRCIDQLRRPLPPAIELFEVSRAPLHDPLIEAERREDLRRLVQDVRRLPEQQRSALLMRELEGLSYAELADALDVSVPAVKSLLVRARIGLVEAIDARDAACPDIRADLATAHDRGVRASGRVRRHMRDCGPCRDYRAALRSTQQGLGALSPGHGPLTAIAKLLGIGGAGSGAAGGGAAAAGGAAAISTGTAAKVAAIICSAAVVTGGAAEVRQIAAPAEHRDAPARRVARIAAAPLVERLAHPARVVAAPATHRATHGRAERHAAAAEPVLDPTGETWLGPQDAEARSQALQTGGAIAPDEAPVAGGVAPADQAPADTTAPGTAGTGSTPATQDPSPAPADAPSGGTTTGPQPPQGGSATAPSTGDVLPPPPGTPAP